MTMTMSPTTEPPTETNRLQETFRHAPAAAHGPAWDGLWRDAYTPWDRGGPSLALHDLLTAPPAPRLFDGPAAPRATALVPGCGRGYDVLLLAALGYDVVGLDFSAEAGGQARELERRVLLEGAAGKDAGGQDAGAESVGMQVCRPRPGVPRGRVSWATGDFFDDAWWDACGQPSFDLVFDYTVRVFSLLHLCRPPPTKCRG